MLSFITAPNRKAIIMMTKMNNKQEMKSELFATTTTIIVLVSIVGFSSTISISNGQLDRF
jgi:hypothetical protein